MNQTPYPLHPEPHEIKAPPYPLLPKSNGNSWLDQHPHWKVLFGCLALVFLIGGFIVFVLTVAEGSLRSSEVYNQSVTQAQANAEVQSAVGNPFRVGRIISGQINVSGSSGQAHLLIPIFGSNGSGTIEAEARKTSGVWRFQSLLVRVDGQDQPIDLLQANPSERDF